jgi:hypothetical protein
VELAAELEASLGDLSSASSVQVRENGGRVALFATLAREVRGAAQKPMLHVWSEQLSFARRLLAITTRRFPALRIFQRHRIAGRTAARLSPALRFHPSTDILFRYFSPEINFVRVGLAETWRRGLRVVMRQ